MEYPGYRKMEAREYQLLQVKVMKRIHDFCVANNIKYYMIGGTLLGAIRHKGFIPWDDDMDIAMMRDDYEKFMDLFPCYFTDGSLVAQRPEDIKHYYPGHGRVYIADTLKSQPGFLHYKDYNNQMFIDLFPLDNVPELKEDRKMQEQMIIALKNKINKKVYRVFSSNSVLKVLIKRMMSALASFESLGALQKQRTSVMTQYNNTNSGYVCSMASHYSYTKQTMHREIYGEPALYEFEGERFYGPAMWKEYLIQLFGENYMQLPPVEKRTKPNENFIKI